MDQTLNDEGVKGVMDANYRYVKLDIGKFDRHQDLLKQHKVEGVPHFLVFDPNGELVAEQSGYLPPDNFKDVLMQSVFKRQLSVVRQPGIVVYVAVKANRTLEDGTSETDVRMMRIESSPNGAPGDWVQTSRDYNFEKWKRCTQWARDPEAPWFHKILREDFFGDPQNDDGKMVFFQDRTGASVTPAMLGFADASVLTGSVADAFHRRQDLKNVTPIVPDFTGFVVYPVTKADLQLMFPEQAAKLEDWQKATEDLQVRAREAGLSLFGPDAMRELASKQDFLDQLVKAHNIIFVACHADEAVITIPGQKPIEVSPADIAALNLVNKPFVFLRVCESSPGDNSRFADAFLKAGAIGVCVNTGTIEAADANLHVSAFISGLHQARSIDGALRSMTVKQKVMSALYTLKEQGTESLGGGADVRVAVEVPWHLGAVREEGQKLPGV